MQQTQYRLTPRLKWKIHHHCAKIPKSECPDIWTRLPNLKWPKSWSSMEDPVVPLERNLYGHPLAGPLWDKTIEKHSIRTRLGTSSKFGMFIRSPSKRAILVCVCGWNKTGWKETKHWPNVESTFERSRFGRTAIIPWPCLFGLHSTRMSTKQGYCGQL